MDMRAVGKGTAFRETSDVVEGAIHIGPFGPQLKFADAGAVDQQTARRQRHQLAPCSRVPAAVIVGAHGPATGRKANARGGDCQLSMNIHDLRSNGSGNCRDVTLVESNTHLAMSLSVVSSDVASNGDLAVVGPS